jgi:hypothetical protein
MLRQPLKSLLELKLEMPSCSISLPLGTRINNAWIDSSNSKLRLVNSRPGHNQKQHRVNKQREVWEQPYCASADDGNDSAEVTRERRM